MAGKFVDVTLRLIDKMTSPLNSAGAKLKDSANQWTKAGKQIQSTGKSISAVGAGMTKAITVPIVGAGVAAVKTAADFEKGMSTVQSIAGDVSRGELAELSKEAGKMGLSFEKGANSTQTAMNILGAKAKEMGAKTKFSATEATDAFKYMAMAGWKTTDMMKGIDGVMKLAGATGEDLASTSDIVTDALTAFGKSAGDTNEFVDVLAQTANNSNTNVSMLGESFKYVAPVAGSLKYSVQDTAVALGVMANSGIKASTAGTSLRSWMSRMAAPTDQVAAAMKQVGISLTDSSGKTKDFMTILRDTRSGFSKLTDAQKAQAASALAGKTGMSGLLSIVNASDKDFNKLTKQIYNADGACQKMYDTAQNNLVGQLTILKSTVESIAISFGNRMTPHVKKATEWLQKMADKFNALSPKQQDMIIKLALTAAAAGPAILIFGKMVTTAGKVASNIGKVGKAFKTFGSIAGIVTSPAGIVVAVLLAIVAAGILVWKNWDKIKAVGGKAFGYVVKVMKACGVSGDSLKKKLAPIGERFLLIGKHIKEFWTAVKPILGFFGNIIKVVFGSILTVAVVSAVGSFSWLFSKISVVVAGLLKIFDGIIEFLTGVFSLNWKKAWSGIRDIFGGIFETIPPLCKKPFNALIGIINGAISGINKIGVNIPNWVPGIGGKSFSINIPKIPQLAKGTKNWRGGIVQVHEQGGEIIDLPRGSRVYPHDESVQMAYKAGRSGGGKSVVVQKFADQIVIREEADIHKFAKEFVDLLEKTSDNMGGDIDGYIPELG